MQTKIIISMLVLFAALGIAIADEAYIVQTPSMVLLTDDKSVVDELGPSEVRLLVEGTAYSSLNDLPIITDNITALFPQ